MLTYKLWYSYTKPSKDQPPDRVVEIEEDEAQYETSQNVAQFHGFQGVDEDSIHIVWVQDPFGAWSTLQLDVTKIYNAEYVTQEELDNWLKFVSGAG